MPVELTDLKERHADLRRQFDEEQARSDAQTAAPRNVRERLGSPVNGSEIDTARALVANS